MLVVLGLTRKWLQSMEDEDSRYLTPMNVTLSPDGIIVVGITLIRKCTELLSL